MLGGCGLVVGGRKPRVDVACHLNAADGEI